jgi:cytochrome P450
MNVLLWILSLPLLLVLYLAIRIAFIAIRFEIVKKKVPIPSLKWYSMLAFQFGYPPVSRTPEGHRPIDMMWAGANIGGNPTIMVSNPELMKEILNLRKDPALYHAVQWFLGDGLVTAEGDIWRFYRRNITPLFHFGVLKNMIPSMQRRITLWMDDIRMHEGKQYPAFDLFEHLTMSMIVDLAFGHNFDVDWMLPKFKELGESIGQLFLGYSLIGEIWRYIPTPFMLRYNQLEKEIRTKILERIQDMKKKMSVNEEPENLITMLINIQRQDKTVTDDHIIDHCLTFLFAGHETVATTSCWIMYYLGMHTKYQQMIADEAKALGEINVDNMSKLSTTKNIISETLRLRPILRLATRITDKELALGGVTIPAGISVTANFWGNHMDPNVWKSPDDFIPERFSEESPNRHAFAYCPFSAGPRNCVGLRFAQQEATLILANLMREFVVDTNIKGDVKSTRGVAKPAGLVLTFTPRK